MIENILFCSLGGFIGAILRYKIGGFVLHHTKNSTFPFSTFAVNFLGSFLFGFLFFWNQKHQFFNQQYSIFIFTGILGAFTTFSAFCYETVYLIKRKKYLTAYANIIFSLIFSISAIFIGKYLI